MRETKTYRGSFSVITSQVNMNFDFYSWCFILLCMEKW